MKKFLFLIILLVLVSSPSFAGIAEWVGGTTYLNVHNVSGTLTNGMALLCMIAPIMLIVSFSVGMYLKHSNKLTTKRA